MIDDKNQLLVSTDGDMIYVICKTERQQEMVVKRMTTDNCMLEDYEIWEEDEEYPQTTILKFRVLDEYEIKPELN